MRGSGVIELIWDNHHLVKLERSLWLDIMKFQQFVQPDLIDQHHIDASTAVRNVVNLGRIREREAVLKHDLVARLQEFNHLAGHQRHHLGMTSADIVENTYSIRIRESLIALGLNLRPSVKQWMRSQPIRGVRGPVGTDVDQYELLGSAEAVEGLNWHLAETYGFHFVALAPAQTLPRSLDMSLGFILAQEFYEMADIRVMLAALAQSLAHAPWLEGDVASSVVRRYCWPKMFEICYIALGGDDARNPTVESGEKSGSEESPQQGGEETTLVDAIDGDTLQGLPAILQGETREYPKWAGP